MVEVERLRRELEAAPQRVEKAMKRLPKKGADQEAFSAALDEQRAAERRLAAARGAVPARSVDPRADTVESLALAELEGAVAVKMGPPNDEVLHGHPLYGRGLGGYGTYVVENSRWLAELIEINRVHERFDPQAWEDKRHFLLVFHDETVEAIARDIEVRTVRMSMRALLAESIEKLWPE